uniref:MoaD/ThiS family protein n=1 Tax=Anaerolinea thermolimosa TaxID=229919 RepID=A0A7C4PL52_9CHLR
MSMKIRVKLFASFGKYRPGSLPGTPFDLELPEGATLRDLIHHLGLPEEEVKVCFVNGRVEELDYTLSEGDEAGIFPPIGGGHLR